MDPLSSGLSQLLSYLGNILLPSCAGLCVVVGIYQFSERKDGWRYFKGAMACLLVAGFLALVKQFAIGGTPDAAMHALAVWLGNIILPTYSVFCFMRGILAMNGFMERLTIGDDYARYFITGFLCFCASGVLDLILHFVNSAAG